MKKVILDTLGQVHSGLSSLIDTPPEGYVFLTNTRLAPRKLRRRLEFSEFRWVVDGIIPLNIALPFLQSAVPRKSVSADVLFSYNHVSFLRMPWVLQVEFAHSLVGRGFRAFEGFKRFVAARLGSTDCRSIIVWTENARKSLQINFENYDDWSYKIALIPQAVPSHQPKKKEDDGIVDFLFVGSINDPRTFYSKGGIETLEAFLALERRVARVRLTVRAKVPECVRARYALDSRKNITVVDSPVNPNELGDIFSGADIFLYPTHEAQNFVVLDAMSYGLPVVTTQIGSSGRIANGHNGFVLRALPPLFGFRAQRARGYHLPYETIPISQITSEVYDESAVLKAIQSYKNQIIDEIIETSLKLIDNPKLRLTAGEKGRAAVTTGIHSIEERNRKLKSILDNATAGTG